MSKELVNGKDFAATREPRKQKKSVSYAFKAVHTHITTLKDAERLTEDEAKKISEILQGATEKFVKEQYGI